MENSEMAPLAPSANSEASKLASLLNVVGAVSAIALGFEAIVRAINQIHGSGKDLAAMRRKKPEPPQ